MDASWRWFHGPRVQGAAGPYDVLVPAWLFDRGVAEGLDMRGLVRVEPLPREGCS